VGADVIWADQDDHGTNEEQCHDRGLMIGFHSLKQRLVKRNWARSSGTAGVLACIPSQPSFASGNVCRRGRLRSQKSAPYKFKASLKGDGVTTLFFY
jgi:hypothetical protein